MSKVKRTLIDTEGDVDPIKATIDDDGSVDIEECCGGLVELSPSQACELRDFLAGSLGPPTSPGVATRTARAVLPSDVPLVLILATGCVGVVNVLWDVVALLLR